MQQSDPKFPETRGNAKSGVQDLSEQRRAQRLDKAELPPELLAEL